MIKASSQRGVGLIEVMVALLLLAVAVLGFSALQMNALNATDEGLARSRAMSISKGLSENMRINNVSNDLFAIELNKFSKGANSITDYCTNVKKLNSSFDKDSCQSKACTSEQIAALSTWQAASLACEQDIILNMVTCPEMSDINARQCIITSWGSTLPTLNDSDKNACGNNDGSYKRGSHCLVMEAY